MSAQPIMKEVRVPVFDFVDNLEAVIDEQRRRLKVDGFEPQDTFYEFSWTGSRGEGFEAVFKKLRETPDGTPALFGTVKPGAEPVFAFVVLNFDRMQDAIKARLAELKVGEAVAFKFKVG